MVRSLEKDDLESGLDAGDGEDGDEGKIKPLHYMRDDAFADTRHWVDDGCDVSPSCLTCPLPVCRYDIQGGIKMLASIRRNEQIMLLHSQGHTAEFISGQVGISLRSVFRILRKQKPDPSGPVS